MSLVSENPAHARGLLRHELHLLHGNWGWYLALGISLIVLGMLALGTPWVTTLTSVRFLGVLLLVGGVFQTLGAFGSRRWSGFFTHLLTGLLYLAVGALCLERPLQTAVDLTLLIAAFLVFGGTFRIIAGLSTRFPNWGWTVFNGAINILLGVMIWRQWPGSALWVIGLFVGIEMIFAGWTWVALALAFRRLPRESSAAVRVA